FQSLRLRLAGWWSTVGMPFAAPHMSPFGTCAMQDGGWTSAFSGRAVVEWTSLQWPSLFYSGRTKLTTVAQSCGYPVDGQMDCLHHALVGIAGPMTLQQFDLYMVERIEVGKAVLDRARQQGILVEQCLLTGDGEQHFNRVLPFGAQPRKDSFAELGVLDELRVA